ncbi:MAG: porin family protein [Bacteroidota bacterium]
MNYNLPLLVALSLMALLTINTYGLTQQLDTSSAETIQDTQSKYTIRIQIGATGSLMGGQWVKDQKSIVLNYDSTYLTYGQYKPAFGFYFGGILDYSINEKFSVSSGLLFTQRKFKENSQYNYYHPTAQFDENLSNKITYQTTHLNIPLRAKLNTINWIEPFIGIGINFPLSSKAHVQTSETTTINNEIDQERSGTIRDTTLDHKDNTRNFLFSLETGATVPIANHWNLELSAERTTQIFELINAHVWTGKLGVSYQLSF